MREAPCRQFSGISRLCPLARVGWGAVVSDSGGDGRVEPTELVAGLAGLLLSEETISGLLDIVVNLAASTVAGVDGASVSMLVGGAGQWETSNASSESVREVDEAQYEDGAGPCVEAMRTGEEVTIAFPADRWPTF